MSEPTPPRGDDAPDSVLDELKLVFGAPEQPAEPNAVETDTAQADTVRTDTVKPRPAPPTVSMPTVGMPTIAMPATNIAQTSPAEPAQQRATIVIGGDDSLPDA